MKTWLVVSLGGQRWGVHLVSPRSKHLRVNGKKTMGTCDYDKCAIYISTALDDSVREDTLWHELLHALLFVSGADRAYGGDPMKDEQVVSSMTPMLHRLLRDLGFSFPKAYA